MSWTEAMSLANWAGSKRLGRRMKVSGYRHPAGGWRYRAHWAALTPRDLP